MVSITWTPIETVKLQQQTIQWPWLVVVQTLRDVTHLMITAEGEWTPAGSQLRPFPPDGHMGLPVQPDKLLMPDCAAGALLGKLGGSSATLAIAPADTNAKPPASVMFHIGAHCIVSIPNGIVGPLFIGFNWTARPLELMTLKVVVAGAAPV